MYWYSLQERDQTVVDAGYPDRSTDDYPSLAKDHFRASRRLAIAEILEDTDVLVGGNCTPELYASVVTALALYELRT